MRDCVTLGVIVWLGVDERDPDSVIDGVRESLWDCESDCDCVTEGVATCDGVCVCDDETV